LSQKKQRYTSDVTDKEWQVIEPLLPLERDGPGRPLELDMRQVVNSIFYVMRTGCQWENLPKDYPNYNSIYYHYRKWCLDGTWRRINTALRKLERRQRGRNEDPSAGAIDTQSIKTTEAGGERGYDAGKKINGRKQHIAVDTVGNLLEVVMHAAGIQDYHGARLLLAKLTQTVSSLQKLWADGIYKKDGLIDWVHESFNIVLDIVERAPDQVGFQVLPRSSDLPRHTPYPPLLLAPRHPSPPHIQRRPASGATATPPRPLPPKGPTRPAGPTRLQFRVSSFEF
jgi:putative transposase